MTSKKETSKKINKPEKKVKSKKKSPSKLENKKETPVVEKIVVEKESSLISEFFNLSVIVALAALVVAGAIGYSAYNYTQTLKINDADLDQRIEEGIERFIEKQKKIEEERQANENKIIQLSDVSTDDDAILGDPDAPVTIVEFSDYDCPYCKKFVDESLSKIKEKYIETGKAKLVYRDFPLAMHDPSATTKAMAAECVREQTGDEGYFEYHDELFAKMGTNIDLEKLALTIGANQSQFSECLSSEKYASEVKADFDEGKSYGVTGTPAVFINGWFLKGAYPYAVFEQYIEAELAKVQ